MKVLIKSIIALCSLVFAEEFSLDLINIDDRAEVGHIFNPDFL